MSFVDWKVSWKDSKKDSKNISKNNFRFGKEKTRKKIST
jgi:hypothetical protein